ncbi:MAG: aspartate aminotransferase family protein [Bacteroidia bacterium]|nr:aspartate aminotransferase family protein [Bacteroidia bacterium]
MTQRELFLKHVAQTSPFPLALEIEKAEGCYLYDTSGKQYLDLISGISVCNLGHRHPAVVTAIKEQLDKYMHVMVYGEYIQSPQVRLAHLLTSVLPSQLQRVYFVNSGAEAIEGAIKLAKKFTRRHELIAFKNAYHGSTNGALSLMGDERLKQPFRPLLPGVQLIEFNNEKELERITKHTAAVIVEPIQGEAGIVLPSENFMKKLRQRCSETETLLVFDEVQTGYGRTGKLFAYEHYGVIPDILCVAKGIAGGMPLGAFIASDTIMSTLSVNPELGHITTFGGNPLSCAAGLAVLHTILTQKLINEITRKQNLFLSLLKHPCIKEIRSKGLMMAIEFEDFEQNKKIIDCCIHNGVIVDWFLFNMKSMRIAPPIIISDEQIKHACAVIINALNS